jgi:hypothetical protein
LYWASASVGGSCEQGSSHLAVLEVRGVLELLLQGELVELLAKGKLPVDPVLGNVKADDIEEAFGPECLDEDLRLLSESFRGVDLGQVDCRD